MFKLLTAPDERPISTILNQSLFIGVHNPESQSGFAMSMPTAGFDAQALTQALNQARGTLKTTSQRLEIKLVCPSNLSAIAIRAIRDQNLTLTSHLERDGKNTEIYFYPTTGRLRVAKEIPAASATHKRTRVLIVDASATIRKLLSSIFSEQKDLEVVGVAERPSQVEKMLVDLKPDVITLDIHMPEMDGVTLLKKYYSRWPIPTVMITSVSREEGPLVLNALEAGAIDYIQKPTLQDLSRVAPLIIEKVQTAAKSRPRTSTPKALVTNTWPADLELDPNRILAIGSSTGGTEALKDILTLLPSGIPPTVIVQHIPPVFSAALAKRLNDLCPFEVKEAEAGDELLPGRVLIAPGGRHMEIRKVGTTFRVLLTDEAPVRQHRPSVDTLFESIAQHAGARAVGAILTGMGTDGAQGLLKMRQMGSSTFAQDEATCVVFGMPREAIRIGAATEAVPLPRIASKIVELLSKKPSALKKSA